MGRETTSLFDQRVYAQATQPVDERDGILWVDTSVSPRETKVYSESTSAWENVAVNDYTQLENTPTGTDIPEEGLIGYVNSIDYQGSCVQTSSTYEVKSWSGNLSWSITPSESSGESIDGVRLSAFITSTENSIRKDALSNNSIKVNGTEVTTGLGTYEKAIIPIVGNESVDIVWDYDVEVESGSSQTQDHCLNMKIDGHYQSVYPHTHIFKY